MNYSEFLTRVINEGILAAKADYINPKEKAQLDGSLEGFEKCRGKSPEEIKELLLSAAKLTADARDLHTSESTEENLSNYWKVRCSEAEIEWVANVVSAVLMNEGYEIIVPPTAHGVMKAHEILSSQAA